MKASRAAVALLLATLSLLGPARTAVDAAAILCGDDAKTTATPAATGVDGHESLSRKEAVEDGQPTATVGSTTEASEVKQFFRTVQCTLEKARPWVEEIEKEAKRLEQTAKRFGEGVFHRLGDFVEKLISSDEVSNSPSISLLTRLIGGGGGGGSGSGAGGAAKPPRGTVLVEEDDGGADDGDGDEPEPQTEAAVVVEQSSGSPSTSAAAAAPSTTTTEDDLDNQIHGDLEGLKAVCPEGYVADVHGVCRRVSY